MDTSAVINTRDLGHELGEARGEIPQEYIARLSGYNQSYISRVEKGEREPTVKLVHAYAEATGRKDLLMRAYGIDIPDLIAVIEKATRYDIMMQLSR